MPPETKKPIKELTAMDLYKFVTKHGLEYHCNSNTEIILFVPIYLIEEFNKLIRPALDEYMECVMKEYHFGFPTMIDLCESCDIDPKKVFHPKGWDYHKEL